MQESRLEYPRRSCSKRRASPPDVGVSLGRALGPGALYHLLCKTSMLSQTGEHGPLFGDGVIIVVSAKAYMYCHTRMLPSGLKSHTANG